MSHHNPVLDHFKVPDSNVFFMSRFRATPYHQEISDTVESTLHSYGLEFVRADNPNWAAETLWDRVRFCIEASRSGIAVFESIDEADINPNVSLELGYMMALGRPCLLLKEQKLEALQSDLCGHLYKKFDSRNISRSLRSPIQQWLQEVGVRKRSGEVVIVFVSIGGTCRCAIAKAVTGHLLKQRKEGLHIRIESRAIQPPDRASATDSGRRAIKCILGEDLLADHRPRNAGVAFLHEADFGACQRL